MDLSSIDPSCVSHSLTALGGSSIGRIHSPRLLPLVGIRSMLGLKALAVFGIIPSNRNWNHAPRGQPTMLVVRRPIPPVRCRFTSESGHDTSRAKPIRRRVKEAE
jgi:hypothetical protein